MTDFGHFRAAADLERSSKVFKCQVVQANVRVFSRSVFEMVCRETTFEDILRAKQNDILLSEIGVKIAFGVCGFPCKDVVTYT